MPSFETKYFDTISYDPDSVVEFPSGLPGFDQRRRFVALQFPDSQPLVFLQNLEDPELCFLTLPVLTIDPHYQLRVTAEDRAVIGLPPGGPVRIAQDVLCLVVLSLRENGPTANLLAPVVVNLRNRKGVQAVAADSGYSHQHVLLPEGVPVCS